MMKFPFPVRLRHWFIISRWQKWLFPVVCCIPYLAIRAWLLMRGLFWLAQVLLAPLLMGAACWSHALVGSGVQNAVAWS